MKRRVLFDEAKIDKITGGLVREHYEHAFEYGERAWRVYGHNKDLIVWDCGNGWYSILKEIRILLK